jgi:hypothetical protein
MQRLNRLFIAGEIERAEEFYRFCHTAYKKGFETDLILRVDGQTCKVGLAMTSGTCRELFEYLCNWSAGERLKAVDKLIRYDLDHPDTAVFDIPTGSRGSSSGDTDSADAERARRWL